MKRKKLITKLQHTAARQPPEYPRIPRLQFANTYAHPQDGLPSDWLKRPNAYVFERKWDGHQCRLLVGFRPYNVLLSRRVSSQTGKLAENQDKLPLLRDWNFGFRKRAVLEGELVHPDPARNSADAAHFIAQGLACFRVWDLIWWDDTYLRAATPLVERQQLLHSLLIGVKQHSERRIEVVETYLTFTDAWANVAEGVVVKPRHGIGTSDWARVLQQHTDDFIICGYADSSAVSYVDKGWIATVEFAQYVPVAMAERLNMLLVKVPGVPLLYEGRYLAQIGTCSGFTQHIRQQLSENRELYLGSVIQVKYKQRLPSGRLRQPRYDGFRADKAAINCCWPL